MALPIYRQSQADNSKAFEAFIVLLIVAAVYAIALFA
jgi:hypothetical protein